MRVVDEDRQPLAAREAVEVDDPLEAAADRDLDVRHRARAELDALAEADPEVDRLIFQGVEVDLEALDPGLRQEPEVDEIGEVEAADRELVHREIRQIKQVATADEAGLDEVGESHAVGTGGRADEFRERDVRAEAVQGIRDDELGVLERRDRQALRAVELRAADEIHRDEVAEAEPVDRQKVGCKHVARLLRARRRRVILVVGGRDTREEVRRADKPREDQVVVVDLLARTKVAGIDKPAIGEVEETRSNDVGRQQIRERDISAADDSAPGERTGLDNIEVLEIADRNHRRADEAPGVEQVEVNQVGDADQSQPEEVVDEIVLVEVRDCVEVAVLDDPLPDDERAEFDQLREGDIAEVGEVA